LIYSNITVEDVRNDLDTLIMDADVIESLLANPEEGIPQIEIRLTSKLRGKVDPKFIELSERLENLSFQHEQGLLQSLDFLKSLLDLANDVVQAENSLPEKAEEESVGLAALTELFENTRNKSTPVIVERIVEEIDAIVRQVRFPGWQKTAAGEREVQKALRRTLLKYKLHNDQDLFDKAYGYIVQYY
jgi:type I restriction enzyme R subunit